MRGQPGGPGRRGPPRFYPNLDGFLPPPPPCRKRARAGRARINYPREWSRRSDFSTSAVLRAPPCASSSPPPSVPLFVRASPNRNSFRPEVSVAHELRRYVVSPASRHLLFLPPLPPSPNSVTRNPTAIVISSRCCSVLLSAIQLIKRSTEFFLSDRDRRWERKKGGEKEQRNERTDEPRYRFGSHSRCARGNSRRH